MHKHIAYNGFATGAIKAILMVVCGSRIEPGTSFYNFTANAYFSNSFLLLQNEQNVQVKKQVSDTFYFHN